MLDLRLSWEFIGSASGEYGTAHSAQLANLQLLVCGGSPTDKLEIIREMTLPLAFEHLIIAPTILCIATSPERRRTHGLFLVVGHASS